MRLKKFAMLVALSAAWAPHTKREALSYRRMMFSSLNVTVQDWLCSFWNEKSVFFAFIEQLVEESAAVFNTRAFKRTPQIEAAPIGCSNVWRPAWWCHEDDKVVCLL